MQVEVVSYLFLVGLLGLKATPAYILAAYMHHNFQFDNRIVSRTILRKALEGVPFAFVGLSCKKSDFTNP